MPRPAAILVTLTGFVAAACAPPPDEMPVDGSVRFQRICSVTVATDEMLAELVPLERLAGVSYMVDDPTTSNVVGFYPPSVARVDGNLEMILETEPDLVLVASYTQQSFLDMLRRAGVRTLRYDLSTSFAGVMESILALGKVVGEPERAAAIVASMEERLARLDQRLAGVSHRPRVFYWARGFTSGSNSSVGEMIERAGGVNAAAELGIEGVPPVSIEAVLAADPDVLLVPDWVAEYGGGQDAFPEVFQSLTAVQQDRVMIIEARYISTVSQFLVDGTEQLARMLHPEAFGSGG